MAKHNKYGQQTSRDIQIGLVERRYQLNAYQLATISMIKFE